MANIDWIAGRNCQPKSGRCSGSTPDSFYYAQDQPVGERANGHGMGTAKALLAMQNFTHSSRFSGFRFIAVLLTVAALTTLATAASRQISDYLQTSRENASHVRTIDWQNNQGHLVPCPGSANVCPGGTLAPASLFYARY